MPRRLQLSHYVVVACIITTTHAFTTPLANPRAWPWLTGTTSTARSASIHMDESISSSVQDSQRFRQYLRTLPLASKNKAEICQKMKHEVEHMVARYSKTNTQDMSNEEEKAFYQGPAVAPSVECYTMVLSAYARANLGIAGAQEAEAIYQQCWEQTGTSNVILKTNCLRIWARAGDWKRADWWLQDMEETFQQSGQTLDAPDSITYTVYLEALANTKTLSAKEIGKRTRDIWQKMRNDPSPYSSPTRLTYHAALRSLLAAEHAVETLDFAEDIFRELQADYRQSGNVEMKPSALSMQFLFQIAAHCNGGLTVAQRAYTWWKELNNTFEKSSFDPDYLPTEGIYSTLLTAFAHVEPQFAHETVDQVDEILKVLDIYNTDPLALKPGVHVYTAAINAKANARTIQSCNEAELILRAIPSPDAIAYQCAIKAYARIQCPKEADKLVWELQNIADESDKIQGPDLMTLSTVITAWSRTRKIGQSFNHASDRALKLGYLILKNAGNKRQRTIDPWILDDVLQMLSVSHRKDAGKLAESFLEARGQVDGFAPSYHSYVMAIDAWANSGMKTSGKKALSLLKEIESLYKEGKIEDAPSIRVLSSVLIALSKSPRNHGVALPVVSNIFEQIVQCYNAGDRSATVSARLQTCVLSYVNKNSGASGFQKSLDLLQSFKDMTEQGNCQFPTTAVYNCVLAGLAHRGRSTEAEAILEEMKVFAAQGKSCAPDVASMTSVCRAHANNLSETETGKIAEQCLREADHMYRNGDKSMEPDTRLYNSVLNAYAKDSSVNSSAAKDAGRLLFEMEMAAATGEHPSSPDLVSYGCACQAYGRSGLPDSPSHVWHIVDRVHQQVGEGKLPEPDIFFYTAAISTLTNSRCKGSLPVADAIFKRMVKSGSVKPDCWMYNSMLLGWSKSRERARLSHCTSIFAQMKENPMVVPDVESHNAVIFAAARSPRSLPEERLEDFHVALSHFREVHHDQNLEPNSLTYSFFIKACRSLLADCDDRRKLITKAFILCRENKVVSTEVLGEVYRAMGTYLQQELADEGVDFVLNNAEIDRIPDEWCANLPSQKRKKNICLRRWR